MKFVPTLLLLASLGGVASAASITQVKTFSFVPTDTAALTFDKFDTLGGTLTLTSITITTNVLKTGGQLSIDNDSLDPASGNISQSVTITLTSSNVSLTDVSLNPIGVNITATSTASISVGADDGDGANFQAGGPDYATSGVFANVTATNSANVNSGAWGGYSGTGTYVITANGSQGFNTSAFGGAALSITPATAGSNVTVTYNYIPEPASALLGGLGLLTLLRRRRN
ncbi:MAG: hypothetical protein RLZZ398_1949 [Verrucomicrobiota bacterium]|jgi:hypothetical protein